MKYLKILLPLIMVVGLEAKSVYFDGEDGNTSAWLTLDNGIIQNIYDEDLDSRVVNLSPGTYDIGLDDRSWDNTQERVLSWDMKITDAYTIYVSVDTLQGHRWLFYNSLNVDVGFHGVGILNGLGDKTNNGTWQRVVVDLDRDLQDTEPDNRIVRVNGMRFGGVLGSIDNITLDNPKRVTYENGENGVDNWKITDNTPQGATIRLLEEDRDSDEVRENVIELNGTAQDNAFTIGGFDSSSGWNNKDEHVLQLKMRNSNPFTIIVHVETRDGDKNLTYTPTRFDEGISQDGLSIHHGLPISRDGDNAEYGVGTDSRWQTYTLDLEDDLKDYDPDNRLLAVNGVTIRGNTLIDDIELFSIPERNGAIKLPPTIYEDGEDGNITGWSVREGNISDIVNVYDDTLKSRVIELRGGGSYMLGALDGDEAWHNTTQKMISWKMRTDIPYTIYVVVNTTNGLRHLFYTYSPNRGLKHGFDTGIHHGLGEATTSGRWRTVTRDLEKDLKDAEPENRIVEVNGFIYSGGDGGRVDDIVLFNRDETILEDGELGVKKWVISDNTPEGAMVENIEDNDTQGRNTQGYIISLKGNGFDNAYMIGAKSEDNSSSWKIDDKKILQWRFRNFGEAEVIDERGTIKDPNAFEFRVFVDTKNGARELIYTLGAENLGLIETKVIHHGLGDDRIIGSVWSGDDPMNELGLWQTITRDLQEDIWDFEPDNRLLRVNGFEVRNSGYIDDIKMLADANISSKESIEDENVTIYEDSENGDTIGWSIFENTSGTATITNILDNEKGDRVISLQGEGLADAYTLRDENGERWNDTQNSVIEWSMRYSENFTIYIETQTTEGRRYLVYTPINEDRGVSGSYIRFGLGENKIDGNWHTIQRDLQADIKKFEPDNELIAIDSIIIRGSGLIDDIKALPTPDENLMEDINNSNQEDENQTATILEDGEDGNIDGWGVYVNTSGTATITNILDNEKGDRVISLQGDGKADAYRFRSATNSSLNDTEHKNIKWSMNYSEDYTIYVVVNTTNGIRYLTYTPVDENRGLNGAYVMFGLGSNSNSGTWQTFTRDLSRDVGEFEDGNELIYIDSIIIRGSGKIDDIVVF
ncbi:MAG: hypothetical protein GXO06_01250 [Epsilonproteobacteria bacterium]|nr:hypothetical protein [Campylobacterota bacterium]